MFRQDAALHHVSQSPLRLKASDAQWLGGNHDALNPPVRRHTGHHRRPLAQWERPCRVQRIDCLPPVRQDLVNKSHCDCRSKCRSCRFGSNQYLLIAIPGQAPCQGDRFLRCVTRNRLSVVQPRDDPRCD